MNGDDKAGGTAGLMEAQEAANAPRIRIGKNTPLPNVMDPNLSLCTLQGFIIFYFPVGGLSNGECRMAGSINSPFAIGLTLPGKGIQ